MPDTAESETRYRLPRGGSAVRGDAAGGSRGGGCLSQAPYGVVRRGRSGTRSGPRRALSSANRLAGSTSSRIICARHWPRHSQSDPTTAQQLATSCWRFWVNRGLISEGARWLTLALNATPDRSALRARALAAMAVMHIRQADATELTAIGGGDRRSPERARRAE